MGLLVVLLSSLVAMGAALIAQADDISVSPQDDLQAQINGAQAGDRLILEAGLYRGNFVLTQSVELVGKNAAIIDAGNNGHALKVEARDTVINGLRIQNWGTNLTNLDAGIFVTPQADNTRITNNYFQGGGSGIWVDTSPNIKIIANKIEGDLSLRSSDRGNGIHLFNVSGALVQDNEVWHSRDGIYIDTSNGNELIGNYLHDLRYGVHYMYSYRNLIKNNITENTRTGYALMQSKYLRVIGNQSKNDANYGILMNYITYSTLENNRVEGVKNTRHPHMKKQSSGRSSLEGKALFIYNSLFNKFYNNLFADSDMGIHLTAGSENNALTGNAFIGNKQQVKYVATRMQDWSHEGTGNYWSDYLGWDMDGDGIGDVHYEPNDSVDQLLWKYPSAKLLLNSPAVETLRWVQRQFPVLAAQGVIDSRPLMRIPEQLAEPPQSHQTAAIAEPLHEQ